MERTCDGLLHSLTVVSNVGHTALTGHQVLISRIGLVDSCSEARTVTIQGVHMTTDLILERVFHHTHIGVLDVNRAWKRGAVLVSVFVESTVSLTRVQTWERGVVVRVGVVQTFMV